MNRLLLVVCLLTILPLAPAHAVRVNACLGRDLVARADFEGATGGQEGGVVVRNRTGQSCELNGRAVVDFVASGHSSSLPVLVAAGRATDGRLRDRSLVLAPGQRAFVHIRWTNWCGVAFSDVTVRLWLRSVGPRVRLRRTISTPRCDDSTRSSRVAIGPYERVRRYRHHS